MDLADVTIVGSAIVLLAAASGAVLNGNLLIALGTVGVLATNLIPYLRIRLRKN